MVSSDKFKDEPNLKSMDPEKIKKYLFQMAMKREWKEVVRTYRLNPMAHEAKIIKTGDTALHMAVSDGQEDHVEELVEIISNEKFKMQNEQGNTPLHLAASMGNVRMCDCIAKRHPLLVGVPNDNRETPLFLAALHGKKDAFLCLHNICINDQETEKNRYSYCRRKDGDNILHCAISGDYFDLAFQIIHLYGDLANFVNEQGVSPLHLLASKPSAFKSGSHLSLIERIIYHCLYVDELRVDSKEGIIKTHEEGKDTKYPKNYQTCMNFIGLFRNLIQNVIMNQNRPKADPETPVDPDSKSHISINNPKAETPDEPYSGKHQSFDSFPSNYRICFEYIKLLSKALLIVLGLGSTVTTKIEKKKEKHKWSVQIMNELLKRTSMYEYEDSGMNPEPGKDSGMYPDPRKEEEETLPYHIVDHDDIVGSKSIFHELPKDDDIKETKTDKQKMGEGEAPEIKIDKLLANLKEIPILIAAKSGVTEMVEMILKLFPVAIHDMNEKKKNIGHLYVPVIEATQKKTPKPKIETAILIAAKNGVTEMVEKILELFPVAIHDMNTEKKNIVLLAMENRQPHVYQLLRKKNLLKDSMLSIVDDQGNSALHLAAKLKEHKPWLISGAALQMQWEMKWYKFVKVSVVPPHFSAQTNMLGQTAQDIFTETHTEIVKAGGQWLTNTSQSCSVVAALIATVAFATSSAVPGGIKPENGTPTLLNQPAFDLFAIASLVALCFSVTALVIFLSILTSRHEEKDFGRDLPRKLLAGMTSLFVSIASILVSFSAGHFFVLRDKLKYAAFPVYAIACLPVTFFAVAHLPLYVDLVWATFKMIPRRRYKPV